MQRLSFALSLIALAFALAASTARAGEVVEYYHRGLDHYFVTSDANEKVALDTGVHTGWVRTGQVFQVFEPGDPRISASLPVCRFYGNPQRGLDSHFYTATPQECDEVKVKFPDDWLLESPEVFRVHAVNPATAACPANTKAVHRLYNGRADANHRYVTDTGIVDAMLAKGYTLEGVGSPRPIVFCAADIAPPPPPTGTPLCTLSFSTEFPVIGVPLVMTASCTGAPTAYTWINCSGSGPSPSCTATSTVAGPVLYGVVASNAQGVGWPEKKTLNWQPAAAAAPSCTVTASTTSPVIGSPLALSAQCSENPVRYEWLACSPLTPDACVAVAECGAATTSCSTVGRQQGAVLYALRATNNAGTGAKAGVAVTWMPPSAPPPPSPGTTPSCVLVPSSPAPAINSTLTLTASCTNTPTAYQWTNCASTTDTCATSQSFVGTRSYSVTARNASGVGNTATVSINWQQPPTGPPVCTLSANPANPYAGGTSVLTANCTQSPTSYSWVNCSAATGNTCQAANASTGSVGYSVTATNQLGSSAPASITLNWQAPPPAGADFCGNFAKVKRVDLTWGGFFNTNDPGGGFEPDMVVVGRIRVPANATGSSVPGVISIVEFIDGPAARTVSLSRSACDFRGFQPGVFPTFDPTGATKPMAWAFGINPSIQFALPSMPGSSPKLVPGQTYYVNIRNHEFSTGGLSCAGKECNVRITVNAPH